MPLSIFWFAKERGGFRGGEPAAYLASVCVCWAFLFGVSESARAGRWSHKQSAEVKRLSTSDEVAAKNAKTEFIASISHELRTPLTSIQNAVSNMLAGVYGKLGKKMREYLHTMTSDCHRLADLINDLLDIAKLEAGSMPVNRRVMNIRTVNTSAMEAYGQEADMGWVGGFLKR